MPSTDQFTPRFIGCTLSRTVRVRGLFGLPRGSDPVRVMATNCLRLSGTNLSCRRRNHDRRGLRGGRASSIDNVTPRDEAKGAQQCEIAHRRVGETAGRPHHLTSYSLPRMIMQLPKHKATGDLTIGHGCSWGDGIGTQQHHRRHCTFVRVHKTPILGRPRPSLLFSEAHL